MGVVWPSMRFSDEPIPDFPRSVAAEMPPAPGARQGHPARAAGDLPGPGHRGRPVRPGCWTSSLPEEAELEEFGRLVRLLVDVVPPGPQALFAADTLAEGVPQDEPEMFAGSAAAVCEEFARALAGARIPGRRGGVRAAQPVGRGARTAAAGDVLRDEAARGHGRRARARPGARAARDGGARACGCTSWGTASAARLVSFALRGLPEGVRTVKSVTLLQGAFSHYAFAARLPHDTRAGGVLQGQQNRIDGPLVCCHSSHDSALGTLYPLASRMAGDARACRPRPRPDPGRQVGGDGPRRRAGGAGHAVASSWPTPCGKLPASGCVNVDAAAVVQARRAARRARTATSATASWPGWCWRRAVSADPPPLCRRPDHRCDVNSTTCW